MKGVVYSEQGVLRQGVLYSGTGRNSTGSTPWHLFCSVSPALEDRSGRKQSCLLICDTSWSYSSPETLRTPTQASLGNAGSEGQQEQAGEGSCACTSSRHCTSQGFGMPRRGQSLFALGKKKIHLSTSKQRTPLTDNLNPLFPPPPRLRPAAFPKEVAKPSGLQHGRGAAGRGRSGAPTNSGPGTAVRGRGPTAPPSGPEPRAQNRRRTAPPAPHRRRCGTWERGGTAPPHPAARPRRGLSPAGPDPSGRAAKAPRHSVAGAGPFLRGHGQGGRDPCGGHT